MKEEEYVTYKGHSIFCREGGDNRWMFVVVVYRRCARVSTIDSAGSTTKLGEASRSRIKSQSSIPIFIASSECRQPMDRADEHQDVEHTLPFVVDSDTLCLVKCWKREIVHGA